MQVWIPPMAITERLNLARWVKTALLEYIALTVVDVVTYRSFSVLVWRVILRVCVAALHPSVRRVVLERVQALREQYINHCIHDPRDLRVPGVSYFCLNQAYIEGLCTPKFGPAWIQTHAICIITKHFKPVRCLRSHTYQ